MGSNKVDDLLKISFSRLSVNEKCEIKDKGRPVPNLEITQTSKSRKQIYQRKFHPDVYEKCKWLCGCEIRNSLFCFPCLLFGGDLNWTRNGIKDLNHLSQKMKVHETSEKHLRNVFDLAVLGKVNIATQLSEGYRLNIAKQNDEVRKNREIISKIIDCIKFCGNFELPLRGHDESSDSANPGVFRGLLDFAGKLNGELKSHFDTATVFKGNSKTIQNELLDCILAVCRAEIVNEIEKSSFLAIMADETTDVSEKTQEVLVFRYLYRGNVYERFWGFHIPERQDAESLSKYILEQLNIVCRNNVEKLIAQTYDGANVMKGEERGLQTIIKKTYPNAHHVWCYAHKLNLVMEKAVSQDSRVRIFFCSLNGIPAFFSRSPQRLAALDTVSRRIPRPSNTRWNFSSRVVNTVYENLTELKECFKKLQEGYTDATVAAASGHLRTLKDQEFLYWLAFFHRIMPHVDILYDQLQSRNADSTTVHVAVDNFYKAINSIRDQTNSSEFRKLSEGLTRRRVENLNAAAKEVCDTICLQAKDRFKFLGHLSAAKLLMNERFAEFCKEFPSKELDDTVNAYPMLSKEKLRTELSVLYQRNELSKISGALKLHQLILNNGLENSFNELNQLLEIVVTTPMATAEAERDMSTLKRIKTFLRSTMSEDRLNALAMLSIGKELINNIDGFNEKVINEFVTLKNRRMNFLYK